MKLYRCFQALWGVLLAAVAVLVTVFHNNPTLEINPVYMVGLAAVWLVILYAVTKLWQRPWQPPPLAAPLILAVYTAFCLVLCWTLRVGANDSWDYPIVARQAQELVLQGTPPGDYFALYPNNAALLWLYAGLFTVAHALGAQQLMNVLTMFGCLCIAAGQWFTYQSACLLWGKKRGLLALCFALTCPALLFYGAICYTDTVTLPLVSAALWAWLRGRQSSKPARWQALALALTAAAAVLKISAAILAVAFVLDFLLYKTPGKKAMLRGFAASLALFAVLLAAGSKAAKAALPHYDGVPIPYTHWVMMGLNGDGGYNDDDYKLTLAYPTYDERVDFTLRTIGQRLCSMGVGGTLQHLGRKLCYICSDGLCYVQQKLNHGGVNPQNIFTAFIIPGAKHVRWPYTLADAWQLALWILCAVGALNAARRRDADFAVGRMAVFGLLLFLLLWEARSRYIVNFLPLILLCGADGLNLNKKAE